jgi:hypothetical protein
MHEAASGLGRRLAIALLAGWFGFASILMGPAGPALAQAVAPAPGDAERLTQPQLEALLAPIALFPDELLMQVLMASTYPLEIVQAARWLAQGQNAQLRDEALAQALQAQPWDPSVKSLAPFPDLLRMLNEQLEWTQGLGDAVLAQQQDVLNTVQVLRGRAHAMEHLESNERQIVTIAPAEAKAPAAILVVQPPPQIITIAPANPDMVFVPVYNPGVVFGRWPYPAYPPVYFPPPPGWGLGNAMLTGIAFASGVAVVGSLWGWARPAWGRGSVDVNVNRFNSINVNRVQINSNVWRHDVTHRGGLAYRNTEVNNRFRGDVTGGRVGSRDEFRGRMQQVERGGGLDAARQAGGRAAVAANRPNAAGPQGGALRPGLGQAPSGRPEVANRPAASRPAPAALQGIGQGGDMRAAAQRGAASRQGQAAALQAAQQRAAAGRAAGPRPNPARPGGGGGRLEGRRG